jgi:hypothetical protein
MDNVFDAPTTRMHALGAMSGRLRHGSLAVLMLVVGVGCGSDGGTNPPEDTGSANDGADSTLDGDVSTHSDSGVADSDAGHDSEPDVLPDTSADTGADGDGLCSLDGRTDVASTVGLNWANRFGITGSTAANFVAIDPTSLNVLMAGYFAGTTDFGGGVLTNAGAGASGPAAAFLAKFDPGGGYKWAKAFSATGVGPYTGVEGYGVTVDGSGDILLGGQLGGTTDFGGGSLTSTGTVDVFLAKFTSAGSHLWSRHFGVASNFCQFQQAAFNSSGELYVVGETGGNAVDLGCGPLPAGRSIFLAEFDTSGSCTWSKAFGTRTQNERLTVDSTGSVILAGGFLGSIDFGGGAKIAPGGDLDVFIAKFSASGSLTWAKTFDSGAGAEADGIGTDGCDNILVAGDFDGTLNLGSGSLTSATNSAFLAKLDSSGGGIWSKAFVPTGSSLTVSGLAVDAVGGPAITGGFSNSIDFGGGVLLGAGAPNASTYIAKFDSVGSYEWAYAGGPPASTVANSGGEGIAANGVSVLAAGVFQDGMLSLDGTAMTAASMLDTYLVSFGK